MYLLPAWAAPALVVLFGCLVLRVLSKIRA